MVLHPIQNKILNLSKAIDIYELSYRQLGRLIDVNHPQQVKFHLEKLKEKKLLVEATKKNNKQSHLKKSINSQTVGVQLIEIPILGYVDCGYPVTFVDENKIEGYLKISPRLLVKKSNIYALIAKGNSMNRAMIMGDSIEDGDIVIIDSNSKFPVDGDYVVSTINHCANLKKFFYNRRKNQIFLLSESTQNYAPIIIHGDDVSDYTFNGKVVQVIKGHKKYLK